ncbi:MAG TPA: hypothetical protein PK263_02390 [bacterium]|nr:hypothetical protein [bacterium]
MDDLTELIATGIGQVRSIHLELDERIAALLKTRTAGGYDWTIMYELGTPPGVELGTSTPGWYDQRGELADFLAAIERLGGFLRGSDFWECVHMIHLSSDHESALIHRDPQGWTVLYGRRHPSRASELEDALREVISRCTPRDLTA